MDWLIPSIIATFCGSVVLAFVYGFLYHQYRAPYLDIWAASWSLYALRYVFALGVAAYDDAAVLVIGHQAAALLSGTLLLQGTYLFMEKPFSRWWWYGTGVGLVWIGITYYLSASFLIFNLPTFTFLALIYLWTGVIFLRSNHRLGSGYQITGWTFVVWGVHKADYPILRPVAWFAPWGYLLNAMFELVSAFGILLVYFDRVRHDLIASQERLSAFANALPDLGLVMDQRGMYVEVITVQEDLLYRAADQLKGHNMHDILPKEVANAIQGAVTTTIQTGETQIVEYMLDVPAGQRWFEGRTALMGTLSQSDNRYSGRKVVLIARDITERIETEKALHEATERMSLLHKQVQSYADELEQRVEQRTADLKAANVRLQQLSHAKDEFVSNVSHELRTPITSLKLRQYLLSRHPDQLDDHLAVMERETLRLEHTIEDLLTLSRLDQEQVVLSRQHVDLNMLAQIYVIDRTPVARENGLTLHLRSEPDLPLVLADDGLLSQVVNIILTNAINYTPSGERIMLSTATRVLDGHSWAGLSISDTGLGITSEDQKHLFERFFRGKAARESKAQGTGLGLSIAKKIIDEHGGLLEVNSQGIPGLGSTFTLWLKAEEDGAG